MLRIRGTATKLPSSMEWEVTCGAVNFEMVAGDRRKAVGMLLTRLCEALGSEPEVMWHDEECFELIFDDDRPIIAYMLRAARERAGLSLYKMCALLGTQSKTTVAQYETGKHSPGIAKLCELFGVLGYDVVVDVVPHQRSTQENSE